jgi:hypothetical protein
VPSSKHVPCIINTAHTEHPQLAYVPPSIVGYSFCKLYFLFVRYIFSPNKVSQHIRFPLLASNVQIERGRRRVGVVRIHRKIRFELHTWEAPDLVAQQPPLLCCPRGGVYLHKPRLWVRWVELGEVEAVHGGVPRTDASQKDRTDGVGVAGEAAVLIGTDIGGP